MLERLEKFLLDLEHRVLLMNDTRKIACIVTKKALTHEIAATFYHLREEYFHHRAMLESKLPLKRKYLKLAESAARMVGYYTLLLPQNDKFIMPDSID